jgi:predicted DNA-binding transcriptional regulator YafY
MDRVRSAQDTRNPFKCPPDFSAAHHVESAWGVLVGQLTQEIRVRFDAEAARSVRDIQWHGTQKFEELPGGAVIMTVRVTGLGEMKRWIMGFGPSAVVLSPPELRDSIAEESARMAESYKKK